MPSPTPGPVTAGGDTRGIVAPSRMASVATLTRYPAGAALDGLVDWFWAVRWALPPGEVHVQQVLTHPASHVTVGTLDRAGDVLAPPGARVYGVTPRVDARRLSGSGWTVAAKTSGGAGVLTGRPAHVLVGAELPFGTPGDDGVLAARVAAADDEAGRVAVLRAALEEVAGRVPADRLAQAREVTAVASLAEHDRSVLRVEQLAAAAGVSTRTLQRTFVAHLGVGPKWVIRRWRVVEAADAVTRGGDVVWADLAADLGYADQAHLVRDFRAHLGTTPTAFAGAARSG